MGESSDDFIQRCMSDDKMNSEYPDKTQRYAVCISQTKKEETYNDYPEAASNNAKRALKYKEENGSSCGTSVGWARANQLANRESISRDTIARMASFKRHQQNKDVPYDEGCGGIMWDAWGGDAGIDWAIKKLDQLDKKSIEESVNNLLKKLGVIILFFCTSATAQTNKITYKAGLLTPIPVNVMADYQVDVSSALIQANYQIKNKWFANLSTGYFRFRPNEDNLKRFSNIPILAGGKYTFGNFYAGLMAGPTLFNEGEKENLWRWMWVPAFGWTKNHWGVDLLYFNWEEIPNEYNNLGLLVSYSF